MTEDFKSGVYKSLKNKEVLRFIKEIWLGNFYGSGFEYIPEKIFERIQVAKDFDEVIKVIDAEFQDKDFKKFNRKRRKEGGLNEFGYGLMSEEVKNAKSYLDFGCGRMALIRRVCREDLPKLKKVYGYDPKAEIGYLQFDRENRVKFLRKTNDVKKLKDIDLITINYVLHHLTDGELKEAMEVCRRILSKGGEVIILEESFNENLGVENEAAAERSSNLESNSIPRPPQQADKLTSQQVNKINLDLNQAFSKLTVEEKKEILFLNDVLLNFKNLSYMPWTKNYKSIEEWTKIFQEFGFKIKSIDDFGFLKGQKMKGGTVTKFILSQD